MSGRESIPVFHHVHAPRRNVLAPPRLPNEHRTARKTFGRAESIRYQRSPVGHAPPEPSRRSDRKTHDPLLERDRADRRDAEERSIVLLHRRGDRHRSRSAATRIACQRNSNPASKDRPSCKARQGVLEVVRQSRPQQRVYSPSHRPRAMSMTGAVIPPRPRDCPTTQTAGTPI